jgi:hypothetical protein
MENEQDKLRSGTVLHFDLPAVTGPEPAHSATSKESPVHLSSCYSLPDMPFPPALFKVHFENYVNQASENAGKPNACADNYHNLTSPIFSFVKGELCLKARLCFSIRPSPTEANRTFLVPEWRGAISFLP